MWKFLTFNTFIAQDILALFYYIFALALPYFLWHWRLEIKTFSYRFISKRHAVFIAIFIFVFTELFLRMMFEAMIGYFDMHDFLYTISQKL
ncbi:DUF4282 domain-containing protein [Sulfurimonas sp. SAG-AH-194-L11]|nr:DUF4282 domain-containing protein [Sulfurimonas sp. SAG-AH-194-L11]MDF1877773.1 DUF4282 domain-containing protein [Sulfurimonas sp. SAG-AH-194-L11]